MPGNRLQHAPRRAPPASAPRGSRSSARPSGTAAAIAAASESTTSSRCRRVRPNSVAALGPRDSAAKLSSSRRSAAAALAPRRAGAAMSPSSASASRAIRADRLAVHLEPLVEPPHRRLVEPAAQLGQRGDRGRPPLGEPAAHQRRGLVGRKEPPVVPQHHEIVARDQPIGGVAVDHVHLGRGQRLILHRRKEGAHLGESHAVGAGRAREARRAGR